MKRPALTESQSRAISYCKENKYSICALDPGLGKSRVVIEVREHFKSNCLIVCPSYLITNWIKEINKWAMKPNITPFRSGKELYDVCDTDYVVISYDLVQKAPWLFEWCDMAALDEGHSLKSMKAKRTQFIHQHVFENSVDRLIITTGTPIKNRVQEFYSLLALCFYDPSRPGSQFLNLYPSEIDFADEFSYREEYTMEIRNRLITILKWSGLKNVDDLKMWLKGKYLRIKSSDVLDLPPVIYKSMMISDTPDPKLLDAFNSHFAKDGNDLINPTAKAEAALKKAPFTVKYAKDLLEETDCVLIYSDHVAASEEIAKQLGTVALNGKVPASKRSEMADAFQAGEGKVLVATIGSLKEGKDLFRASHIIFNDISWVPGDMKQVIYRINRLGQKNRCTVHRILGSPQDEYILGTIEEKVKVIEKAT